MKISDKLKVREIAGESIILLPGADGNDLTKVLSLNSTAKFLWEELKGKDFTLVDVTKVLTDNFEVEEERAAADAAKWVEQLREIKVIE